MKKYGAKTDKDYKVFTELMELYEFEIIEYKKRPLVLGVRDLQGGNLGNIEGDRFNNLYEILDRMELYHEDYIFNMIWDDYGILIDYSNYEDALEQLKKEHSELVWTIDVLNLILKSKDF